MPSRYYIRGAEEAIYRRRDGAPLLDAPPDEVLHVTGWRKLSIPAMTAGEDWLAPASAVPPEDRGAGPDPLLLDCLVEVTAAEARAVAARLGLPGETNTNEGGDDV